MPSYVKRQRNKTYSLRVCVNCWAKGGSVVAAGPLELLPWLFPRLGDLVCWLNYSCVTQATVMCVQCGRTLRSLLMKSSPFVFGGMFELMVYSESIGSCFCFTKFQALCASRLSEQIWSLYQFHEAWSKLMEWLEESEKSLDSELEIANDPDKIKTQLAQHKVSCSLTKRTLRFTTTADLSCPCVYSSPDQKKGCGLEQWFSARGITTPMGVKWLRQSQDCLRPSERRGSYIMIQNHLTDWGT